jgi:antitoxin (DNA-binding transcriptional repressor) of toxin-antitoxin stability system
MPQYLSAKEFRERMPTIPEDLKQWKEIIVLKKSRPVFKVVPFEETSADLLDRADTLRDPVQPDLQELAAIVHKVREAA